MSTVYAVMRANPGTSAVTCLEAARRVAKTGPFKIETTKTMPLDIRGKVNKTLMGEGLLSAVGTITNLNDLRTLSIELDNRLPGIVGPNFSKGVTMYAISRGIPVIPGVGNEFEIQSAANLGVGAVKIFPSIANNAQEIYDSIIHPLRQEIAYLKDKGWQILIEGTEEYNSLPLDSKTISVTSASELYDVYSNIKELSDLGVGPYAPIIIKLPNGRALDFERLEELAAISRKYGVIEIVASGIENAARDKNIEYILGNRIADSVALGGIFSPDLLMSGNLDEIERRAVVVADILKGIES